MEIDTNNFTLIILPHRTPMIGNYAAGQGHAAPENPASLDRFSADARVVFCMRLLSVNYG